MKNILSLSSQEAEDFFFKEESYINFDIPSYFKFSNFLSSISNEIKGKSDKEYVKSEKKPYDCEFVNHKILTNKDGKYGWRQLQIIHPVLYVSLVHRITESKNWDLIKKRFSFFKDNNSIECMSLPILSEANQSDKEEQVSSWVKNIEQKSIAYSLEYSYYFETDIANCYGSIYTHSVSWALHNKDYIKTDGHRSDKTLIGNIIDKHLRDLSYGQTNGIPQGSTLMDFIAEMVLGYADCSLTKRLNDSKTEDYKIIRYRDDYRIFVNNPKIGEEILKNLTEVLSDLGIRLNIKKTICSNNIIKDSIKPDKFFYLTYGKHSEDIQKELLIIYSIAQQFPDSGTIKKTLNNLYRELEKIKDIKVDINVLISIVVNIALCSPRSYPMVSAILSKMLNFIDNNNERVKIIEKIRKKFDQIPNTGHLQLWLQRISIKIDGKINYTEKLCKVVEEALDQKDLWDSDWIDSDNINKIISSHSIVDKSEISKLDPIITSKEVALFKQDHY